MKKEVPDLDWSIYNKNEEVRIDHLRTAQVRSLLCGLRDEIIPSWVVWEEGSETWRPARMVLPNLRGLDNAPAWPGYLPPDPSASVPRPKPAPEVMQIWSKQRATPRYNQSLEVQIDHGGRVLANRTVNISLGGMQLEKPLSEEINEAFHVIVRKGSDELHMRCRVVETTEDGERTRLFIDHCNRINILRDWILKE